MALAAGDAGKARVRALAPWARAELRVRWRSCAVLTVVVAVLGGVVLTAATGARRTDTALRRFTTHSNSGGVNISPVFPGIDRLPEVAAVDELVGEPLLRVLAHGRLDSQFPIPVAGVDQRLLYRALRPIVRAGRLPRPDRPDEALATVEAARQEHLHVGSRLILRDMSGIIGPANLVAPSRIPPGVGKVEDLTIVGIGVDYSDIAAASARSQGGQGAFGTVYLTPAYVADHGGTSGALYRGGLLELRRGVDIGRLQHEIDALAARHPVRPGGSNYDFSNLDLQTAAIQRAIRPDVIALWLFAVLVGLASMLVVGQALARQAWEAAAQFPVLRALGVTRRQFVLAATAPAVALSVAGSLLAAGLAVLASPLTPVGPARVAEPDLGIAVNFAILGIGVSVLAVVLATQVAIAAWLATSPVRAEGTARPSRLADAVAGAGMSAPVATGLRLALEPGRRAAAIPLRSTLGGTVLAVAALIIAVTFNGDLARLNSSPARYGWSWDLAIDGGYVPLPAARVDAALGRVSGLSAWTGGNYGRGIVAGQLIPAVGLDQLHGLVFPSLLAGRAPRNPGEIALGTTTMRAVGAHVGGVVVVQVGDVRRQLRVTGRAIFPDFERGGFSATDLGVGAATTSQLVHPTGIPPGATYNFFLVRYRQHADPFTVRGRIERVMAPLCASGTCSYFVDRRPNEVNAYAQVTWTPLLLAGILGSLAVVALANALVSSVGRRRRELAILKTLGFTRAQVLTAVAWQATALVVVALLVGLPVGVMSGRWLWSIFANQLGVAGDSLVPLLALGLLVPVALAVGNLVASVPAWAAGRVQPSRILRTE